MYRMRHHDLPEAFALLRNHAGPSSGTVSSASVLVGVFDNTPTLCNENIWFIVIGVFAIKWRKNHHHVLPDESIIREAR